MAKSTKRTTKKTTKTGAKRSKTPTKKSPAQRKPKSKKAAVSRPGKASRHELKIAAEEPQAPPPAAADERRCQDRRKVQRRRQIDPTTCERDYSNEEIEFMRAMDEYKRNSGRMFPTCSEILEVVRGLGYVRQEATEQPVGGESTTGDVAPDDSRDQGTQSPAGPMAAPLGPSDASVIGPVDPVSP
jgi:hypothetical protein